MGITPYEIPVEYITINENEFQLLTGYIKMFDIVKTNQQTFKYKVNGQDIILIDDFGDKAEILKYVIQEHKGTTLKIKNSRGAIYTYYKTKAKK
ncbi:MAG: hypothetical protein LBI42_09760 [Chitinispirillales bacterium]|jgi:hypothetical protein|nr:hypothetical protein [Chitinispirillales bacterium]